VAGPAGDLYFFYEIDIELFTNPFVPARAPRPQFVF